MSRKPHPGAMKRRGAVAVEFAVVLPFLLATVAGMIELTRAYDVQNLLETGAREGARFASMDRSGMLQEGETSNEKLISDVTNFMVSSGVPAGDVQVVIRDAANPEQPFDLDDPANDLALFEVEVNVPFSSVSLTPISEANDYTLSASITFRNGRATISE
ncbi:MAG: pilus assembly protein [Planctomycetes bacterium]|nr:pilus assembly protein [Planctomycetota bacterium]